MKTTADLYAQMVLDRQDPSPFVPSRYPLTYAYDQIRRFTDLNSRAEASDWLEALSVQLDLPVEDLARPLADAYCRRFNIDNPNVPGGIHSCAATT